MDAQSNIIITIYQKALIYESPGLFFVLFNIAKDIYLYAENKD